MMIRTLIATLVMAVVLSPLRAEEPKKRTIEELQGTWLFDSAQRGKGNDALGMIWNSIVRVKDKTLTVDSFLGMKKPLKGTIELDPAGQVGHINLTLEEYDLKEFGPVKIPAGTLAGVYSHEGDRLRLSFHAEPGGARPKSVDDPEKKLMLMDLVKAPKGFQKFPKTITVRVMTADGKPAKGVSLGNFMSKMLDGKAKDKGEKWAMGGTKKTDEKGIVTFDFEDPTFHSQHSLIIAWDEPGNLMGMASPTPASLSRNSELTIELKPICKVKLNLTCDEMKQAGKTDFFHCYAYMKSGQRFAFSANATGQLDCLLPAGEYKLHMYGTEFLGKKTETLIVPKDRSEYDAPEMKIPSTALLTLLGKPAPEFTDVRGWKGDAVKLADLKGKVVLLEFWGYWCLPCIQSMPVLFELHDKFASKGLVIVGVHLDIDGEVDTAAKLDEKMRGYKKTAWKGRDIPFPVVLTSGKMTSEADNASRGSIAEKYGIRGYPSTILIDREGKVVGRFQAHDSKLAIEMMEKLLNDEKK